MNVVLVQGKRDLIASASEEGGPVLISVAGRGVGAVALDLCVFSVINGSGDQICSR